MANSDHLTLPSPAKLNLFLHILGQREDGYHNLQTLYQFVDYCDVMRFRVLDHADIQITVEGADIPRQDNLVYQAALLMRQHRNSKKGIDIQLNKRLPMGAGIGGGSSNAATTLLALNVLWEAHLSLEELHQYALGLGADVPVFVHGHAAWAEGIGEQLTSMIVPECWYLLLFVPRHIDTEHIFNDARLTRDSAALTISHYHPWDGHNDFEPVVRLDYPEVATAIDWLKQHAPARMSGSGSTVFAPFDTREEASRIAAQVPENLKAVVVKGLNHSPLHIALQSS